MNSKNVILVCALILFCSFSINAQDSSKTKIFEGLYLGAGFEMSAFNNSAGYSKITDNVNWFGEVLFDYNKHVQLSVQFSMLTDLGRGLESYNIENATVSRGYYHNQVFSSNVVSAKGNYFFSGKKESNPFYISGGMSIAVQRVHEYYVNYLFIHDGANFYSEENVNEARSFFRFMFGPEAGIGMFLAFGKVNFQSEFTYSARFSPFTDRNYRELSFNLFNGLVYKF